MVLLTVTVSTAVPATTTATVVVVVVVGVVGGLGGWGPNGWVGGKGNERVDVIRGRERERADRQVEVGQTNKQPNKQACSEDAASVERIKCESSE